MKEQEAQRLADEILYHLDGESLTNVMHKIDRAIIQRSMKENGNNCAAAAIALGVKRSALVMRRKRYGLPMWSIEE